MSIQEKIGRAEHIRLQRLKNQAKQVKSLRRKAARQRNLFYECYQLGALRQAKYWLRSARHAESEADWLDYLLEEAGYKEENQ